MHPVEESAPQRGCLVAVARPVRALFRRCGDAPSALLDDPPELVDVVGPGEACGHADDRHAVERGLVELRLRSRLRLYRIGRPVRRCGLRRKHIPQLLGVVGDDELAQLGQGVVLEQHSDVEVDAERPAEGPGHVHREDRIEPVVREGLVPPDPRPRDLQRRCQHIERHRLDVDAQPVSGLAPRAVIDHSPRRTLAHRRHVRRGRGRYGRRLPYDAVALGHDDLLPQILGIPRGQSDRAEPHLRQDVPPVRRGEQRAALDTQVRVLVAPPSVEEAERELAEQVVRGQLVQDQQSAGPEKRLGVAQGVADVPGGMQDVGGDHDVVPAESEALIRHRALDVQDFADQRRIFRTEETLRVVQEDP
ncbi:hypothetical protein SMICM304S_04547 [Streptomyces microflavus]